MKILLIIPAFNEEDSILDVISPIKNTEYDYVVVNDGSKDGTAEICTINEINMINLPKNLGIGGAVQAGYKYAYQKDYDVAIQIDGDGQHDIAYIPALIHEIETGSDLVIGSRFLKAPSDGAFQSTILRRLGIKWLTFLLRVTSGATITDPTSGMRAANRRTIEMFCESYPIDYPEPESIAEAIREGLIVKEVPVIMKERQGGESSIKALASVYYMIKVSLAVIITSIK